MTLNSKHYRLSIDEETGSLVSFASLRPEQEFLSPGGDRRPLFLIQCRTSNGRTSQYPAFDAEKVTCDSTELEERTIIQLKFFKLKGQPIDVEVEADCPKEDSFTSWRIRIANHTDEFLEFVDFPNITVPREIPNGTGRERILWPFEEGVLFDDLKKTKFSKKEDILDSEMFSTASTPGYPGEITSQLMAYYNDIAGLYVATHDGEGTPKIIAPFHTQHGVSLSFLHFLGAEKEARLNYPTVLGAFQGDWYDAAAIYRKWAKDQEWCTQLLDERSAVPKWWLDSPIPTVFLLRGHTDTDDPAPNPEYMPAPESIPHLERLSRKLDSPLVPIVFHWEKNGPWTEPDAFPPYGGEEPLKAFYSKIRELGWHGGAYCSGTRWATESVKTGYDGSAEFKKRKGDRMVCQLPEGKPWVENWDAAWRKSFRLCVARPETKGEALNQCMKLAGYGVEFLQFFDQNLGGGAFFCYSKDHGHPQTPGVWLTEAMEGLLSDICGRFSDEELEVGLSTEGPAAETYIPYYGFADGRSTWQWERGKSVPLYQFLYHEYIQNHHGIFWGFDGPDALLLKAALACIYGDGICIVLRDKGQINRGHNAEWAKDLLDQDSAAKLIRRINKMRRGVGKDYLILGQMQKAYPITCSQNISFAMESGVTHQFPAILSSAWKSRKGVFAQVFVNYTNKRQKATIIIDGKGFAVANIHIAEPEIASEQQLSLPGNLAVEIAPLSVSLVELKTK